jgi:CubicO group peptidase (beta-lactamase class C family)
MNRTQLEAELDARAAEIDFAGVVRFDRPDHETFAKAFGLAHRGYAIRNTVDARLAVASMTKGFTALAVVSLIEQGAIELGTTARTLLGADLPMIAEDVTVEDLLAHRSGIGDYLDEELHPDVAEYVMPVPVHELSSAEDYLAVLDGHQAAFAAGTRFAYNNGAYVVLAILAERAAGVSYHDLLAERVFRRAGMHHTDFPRSDELAGAVAQGYIEVDGHVRSNVLHLPVRGVGDGGAYSTVADMESFWTGLFAGDIVSLDWVAEMVRPRSDAPDQGRRYGLGFWLHPSSDVVFLEGADAGISARSVHDPSTGVSYTVVSNSSDGAWPIAELLADRLGTPAESPVVDEETASA